MKTALSIVRALLVSGALALLAACASLPGGRDAPRVHVVGLDALPGQGLELRFAVKLRVQNPNDEPIDYDGIALDLDIDGKALATGVSDQAGRVPRFGEAVLSVPVSVSVFAAMRQALAVAEGARLDKLPYALRGKLAGGLFGTLRFTDEGTLSWPGRPSVR